MDNLKIIRNPDEELVMRITKALKENNGYCPCSILRNEDTKCICKDFKEKNTEGTCHCGLYIKINNE